MNQIFFFFYTLLCSGTRSTCSTRSPPIYSPDLHIFYIDVEFLKYGIESIKNILTSKKPYPYSLPYLTILFKFHARTNNFFFWIKILFEGGIINFALIQLNIIVYAISAFNNIKLKI